MIIFLSTNWDPLGDDRFSVGVKNSAVLDSTTLTAVNQLFLTEGIPLLSSEQKGSFFTRLYHHRTLFYSARYVYKIFF